MNTINRLLPFFMLAPTGLAQQFVERAGVLPGPIVWSESVVPIDVNEDGKLDLFIVNAQGYAIPGDYGAPSSDPLRPTLLINTGLNGNLPTFEDRTDALIPASIVVHGKSTAVCDVDGDGHEDLVISVAFGDQQRLLRKDPAGPGYLDETFRLPPLVLNSFHVGWGDLDDDGDVDLVFSDAGPNSFSPPGGMARLLINDGAGYFTEAAVQMSAALKVGAQNAKILDIDGDLDLDVVVDGKSSLTHVYLNDGAANFTLDTTLVPAAISFPGGGAYETEWGDLDGDLDIDCMYMNWAGSGWPAVDVAMESQMTQTGVPNLVTQFDALAGYNDQDENDFALLDADDDGDLDLLIAALTYGYPVTPEKLYINSGTFGPGFLMQTNGAFTPILDSTLDLAVADFNNDGRYDVVTANGEIPGTTFDNRFYENVGPPDSTPPMIGRVSDLGPVVPVEQLAVGLAVRSWIQDAVVDDGYSFTSAELSWVVSKGGAMTAGTDSMPHIGGNLHRGMLLPQATTEGLVGAQIEVVVSAEDPQGNASQSGAQNFVVCGAESYGAVTGIDLTPPVSTSPGGSLEYQVTGGQAHASGILVLSRQRASIQIPAGTLLVDPQVSQRVPFTLDSNGEASISIQTSPSAQSGDETFAQALVRTNAHSSGMAISNGIEAVLCD